MKLLSSNCQGMNSLPKQHQVLNMCRAHDISLIQETKLTRSSLQLIKNKWGNGQVYMATTGQSRRGVLTLIHGRLDSKVVIEEDDPNGQFHILLIRIKDKLLQRSNTLDEMVAEEQT